MPAVLAENMRAVPARRVVVIAVTLAAVGGVLLYALLRGDAPVPAVVDEVRRAETERTHTAPATSPPTLADIASAARDFQRNAALYELLATSDVAGVQALLAQARTLPASLHRYDVSRVLYLRFVSLDPVAAANHLLDNTAKPSWVSAVFRSWAHKDFDAAVAYASELGPLARQAAAEAILELDVPAAQRQAAVALLRSPKALANALLWEGRLFAGRDVAQAWRLAAGIPTANWKERRRLLGEVAAAWARTDPLAAMAAIEALDHAGDREKVQPIALRAWADADPHGAVDWLLAREAHKRPQELVAAAMESLAAQDPDAAMNVLTTMPEPARGQALTATLTAMAGADVDKSLAAWEALDARERTQVSMRHFASALTQAAPDRAMSCLLDLPDDARAMASPVVMTFAHATDRDLVLRRIGAIENAALQHEVAQQIVFEEVERDPLAAWRWAISLPAVSEWSVASAVFDKWYRVDAQAALDALSEVRGGVRDRVLEEAVAARVTFDPDQAETLFAAMDSSSSKARVASALVRYFTETNPNPEKAEKYREFVGSADAQQ